MNPEDAQPARLAQWRAMTRRLFSKLDRAAALMMRPDQKRRTGKKWANAYLRTLHRIPDPEAFLAGAPGPVFP